MKGEKKFKSYPRNDTLHVIYSSYADLKTDFFQHLSLQVTPKNSIFSRFKRTFFGYLLSSISQSKFEVPDATKCYMGLVKHRSPIFFEMEGSIPKSVIRKNSQNEWISERFLGFQLITHYDLKEFIENKELIRRALTLHWNSLNSQNDNFVHGDFTHFNILVSQNKEEVFFIDEKKHENSKLYDFFYFYAYLKACLTRCSTLNQSDQTEIETLLLEVITETCSKSETTRKNLNLIQIPESTQLLGLDIREILQEFREHFSTKN